VFRVKIVRQPDRSRQEAVKERIKERRRAERDANDSDNFIIEKTFTKEKQSC